MPNQQSAKTAPTWYGKPWGPYPQSLWDEAVARGRQVIIDRWANTGTLGAYSEFVQAVGLLDWPQGNQWEDHHRAQLGRLLGDISVAEWLEDRPMLSALVVHKDERRPAETFFDLMEELTGLVTDRDKAWLDEVDRCWSYPWG
jgi:outer membrane biogenesis lipoprotein LolB